MDGVDVALIRAAPGERGAVELLAFRTVPYPAELRRRLAACARRGSSRQLARLNVAVGEVFAEAALETLREARVPAAAVRCIGSHGQTVVHLPRPRAVAGRRVRATLQIGEPCVIAERTGITTVADFRPRDLAAGGEGAPLVPLLDHRLYRHPRLGRVALNLGGIANLTALPPGADLGDVIAFDTGPGNALLDVAARWRRLPGGIDAGGAVALRGRVRPALLRRLLAHPFFRLGPPKSADLALFLGRFAEECRRAAARVSTADLLRTLAELTAATVAAAVERHVLPRQPVDEVVVSGGGVHNRALMAALGQRLAPARVRRAEEVAAIPADAKEAVAFAWLALRTLAGLPGNVPGATGAHHPVLLGKVVPAGPGG